MSEQSGRSLAHPQQRLAVNHQSVVAVRVSEFSVDPPIARFVIDLKSAQPHQESYDGNKLVITVTTGEASSVPISKTDSAVDIQPLASGSDEGSNPSTANSSNTEPSKPSAQPPSGRAHVATAYDLC